MSIELPKSLERAMRNAGLVDPRSDNPSLNQWSKESGVHTSTISSFLSGRKSRPANVQKMADALELSPTDLYSMVGRELSPWSPPSGTEKLNTRQRQALNELILAFTDDGPAEKAGEGNADSPTPMNDAEGNSAPGEVTELFTPPPPIHATAAKRGRNIGSSIRREQDEDAERADPDPNED